MIVSSAVLSQAWLKQLPADLRNMVVETGRSLQTKSSEFSHKSENFMIGKWKEAGGSLTALPAGDLTKIREMLADVGETVTKGNPAVHAFFRKVKATGEKY